GYEGHISRPQPTENRMAAERWHPASPVYLLASLDRQILWVGANVESYLGWQPADVVGRAIYSMIHPDDIVLAFEVRAELELGNPTTFVLRISAADGGFTATHCRVNPIKDGQGITQLFLVEWLPSERPSDAGDISYASSRTDREPSVLPPEGMIQLFFDGDLILQDVRPHEPFLGYDPDDIIGAYFTPTGNSREQVMHMINALLSSGERSVDLQTLLFDASGRSHLLPVTSRLLVGDGETFLGLHSTIHLSDGGAAPADSS
ncbi:MAG: PAS domain-containing protein, partial [Actinomycetales bacterium]|nr:PAS domain-containing protein [Actinomycetales bacterium]